MNRTRKLVIILAPLVIWAAQTVHSQELQSSLYEEAVEYQNGEVSVAFDQTPVFVALYVIHARTGFHISVPKAAENQLLNLRFHRLTLEPAVRSLISSIGFNNFALMYDAEGRPSQAVVLSEGTPARASTDEKAEAAAPTSEVPVPALGAGEKEKLQRDLDRWSELNQEERGRIEDRLKFLPPSEEREQLLKEYGRQLLVTKK